MASGRAALSDNASLIATFSSFFYSSCMELDTYNMVEWIEYTMLSTLQTAWLQRSRIFLQTHSVIEVHRHKVSFSSSHTHKLRLSSVCVTRSFTVHTHPFNIIYIILRLMPVSRGASTTAKKRFWLVSNWVSMRSRSSLTAGSHGRATECQRLQLAILRMYAHVWPQAMPRIIRWLDTVGNAQQYIIPFALSIGPLVFSVRKQWLITN